MNYLSIDVGTTCCKCQLFDASGAILTYITQEYPLKTVGREQYVDIDALVSCVFGLISRVSGQYSVDALCFSCFGETFVALDHDDRVLFDPMLYTDRRGEEEAAELSRAFGGKELCRVTGVAPHAMFSLSKLIWLRAHEKEKYARIDKVLLIGDYLGYLLTGKRVIDYSLAARTGLFDIRSYRFDEALCEKTGVKHEWFSTPARAGTVVGKVRGVPSLPDCTLVLGAHDQVCTALGAGVTKPGEAVDGLGTVECITVVYPETMPGEKQGELGLCRIPYAIPGLCCSYVVTYACGSVIKWFKNELLHGFTDGEDSVYSYLEKRMPDEPSPLLLLPLFSGSVIPYADLNAKGALVGLTPTTTDGEIYRAIMEGLAYEMKFECAVAESCGVEVHSAVATGGGANSEKWLQIKADIQGIPFSTLRSVEGGLCGCAVLQHAALTGTSVEDAVALFVRKDKTFTPRTIPAYTEKYEKYKKLYTNLKECF